MNFACSFSQIKIVNHVSGGSLVSFHLGPTTSSAHCTRGILCTLGLKCSSYHFLIQLCTSLSRVLNREMRRAHSPRGRRAWTPTGSKVQPVQTAGKLRFAPQTFTFLMRKVKGRAACFLRLQLERSVLVPRRRRGVDLGCCRRPPRTHQLLFIPETDVWPRSAVFISADMTMIKEIKISQPGRRLQGLRHQPWQREDLRRVCSA